MPVAVSEGGHRRYDRAALEQLQLILDFRELGLSIPDIRAMLAMRAGCRNAVEFRQLLRDRLPAHVAQARNRIERLRRLESELRQALSSVAEDGLRSLHRSVPVHRGLRGAARRASSASSPGPGSAGECTSRARRDRPTRPTGMAKSRAARTHDRSRS